VSKDDAGAGKGEMVGNSFTLSIGPVHPALKEPLRLICEIEGERVVRVDFELSQVHRGVEWMGTRRNPIQILYLSERICGICNICHALAFCRAVESIGDIDVPPRAQYIRTIIAELERIHSHILWAGIMAHEMGFDSVMHYTWRARERVLDTIEYLTGNRITKAMITIGGVRRDIREDQYPVLRETLNFYSDIQAKLEKILLKDPVIRSRTRDTGILSRKDALSLCVVGHVARASGIRKDVRHDEPYAAYPDIGVTPVTPDQMTGEIRGDVYDRIVVRLLELRQSVDIIDKCIRGMPDGRIVHEEKAPKLLAELRGLEGDGIGRHEAPRGEVFHYVKMSKGESPFAWKVRAPTYNNVLSLVPMLTGRQIADIPVIAASIDPCMSCLNRAVVTDSGKRALVDQEAMHRLSVKRTQELKRRLCK